MTDRASPRTPVARIVALMLVIAVAGAGTGCAKWFKKDKNVEAQPVETMYETAHQSMRTANWDRAQTQFRSLIAQYPYGPYTEQALMESAYAQYKSGKLDDAVSSIDKFLRTYPTHRNVPYMYYLRGLANSNRDGAFTLAPGYGS